MTNKEQYIEEVGLFYEKYGLPKMAGRILGCLIASPTDNNSFEYIQKELKASKGSISGNVRLLLSQNMIEKHMLAGDRKSYYKIGLRSLENILDAKVKSVHEFKTILGDGVALNVKGEKRNKIKEIVDYYDFLEKEIPLLKAKWKRKKNKK